MLQTHFYPRLEQFDTDLARFCCGRRQWAFRHALAGEQLSVTVVEGDELDFTTLHQLLDLLWSRLRPRTLWLSEALTDSLPIQHAIWQRAEAGVRIERGVFYQQREAWLAPALWPVMPQVYVAADCPGGRHPLRPRIGDGLLYRKFIAELGEVFELRRAEVARDGELFHRWQHDPRVAAFWEEARSREELDEYLRVRREDPHCEPLIAYFDGVPFAYIEIYWARENRIAPYYEVDDYDIGLHLLVGERRFLGARRTSAWFRAISHFLFLLDPRTQRLVGEPRVDNRRLLRLIEGAGWRKIKEFDFPHKRAALVMCERERFFSDAFFREEDA